MSDGWHNFLVCQHARTALLTEGTIVWTTMPIVSGPEPLGDETDGLLRSGLKLQHMRMIVALEDSGQISAAAHVLNISQPAASRMIAEMEDILGVPLCERLPRGVELTPLWGGARAAGTNHAARTARGRPRDLRPEIRQGRRGVPRRGHRAGDRARRAGDPAHPQELSAHRDQRADRDQRRAGARTPRLTPRLHHRAHSRRP